MNKEEFVQICNQRSIFYFSCNGVSKSDLYNLWRDLSKKGYYKINSHTISIEKSKIDNKFIFESLKDFYNFYLKKK